MIQVSKNELGATLEKAAIGQGYDQGTGQWLSSVVLQAVQVDLPAAEWAIEALRHKPEPPALKNTSLGWQCHNYSVLVAGPLLTDLVMSGEPLNGEGFVKLDVPDLWRHLLTTKFKQKCGAVDIQPATWKELNTLAAKTYVPATDESRARGAG